MARSLNRIYFSNLLCNVFISEKKMSVNNCVFRVAGLLRNFKLKVRIRMHGGTDLLCEYVSRQARLCGGVGRERL